MKGFLKRCFCRLVLLAKLVCHGSWLARAQGDLAGQPRRKRVDFAFAPSSAFVSVSVVSHRFEGEKVPDSDLSRRSKLRWQV